MQLTEDEAESPLLVQRDGKVLVLTLNRPHRLNALDESLHVLLHESIILAARDNDIGAVVLTGAGGAFCSGGDMGSKRPEGAPPLSLEEKADSLLRHGETARLLHVMPKPTIAMVNGAAAGAGLALALACDIRIMSSEAKLTTSYVKVALSGDLGSTYFLTRLVGAAKARELFFLSDKIGADEALRLGLVNRIESAELLRATTLSLAQQLACGPSVALRYIKRNLIAAETGGLQEVMESEAYGMARCGRTQDVKEAALAFREKRLPVFKGY